MTYTPQEKAATGDEGDRGGEGWRGTSGRGFMHVAALRRCDQLRCRSGGWPQPRPQPRTLANPPDRGPRPKTLPPTDVLITRTMTTSTTPPRMSPNRMFFQRISRLSVVALRLNWYDVAAKFSAGPSPRGRRSETVSAPTSPSPRARALACPVRTGLLVQLVQLLAAVDHLLEVVLHHAHHLLRLRTRLRELVRAPRPARRRRPEKEEKDPRAPSRDLLSMPRAHNKTRAGLAHVHGCVLAQNPPKITGDDVGRCAVSSATSLSASPHAPRPPSAFKPRPLPPSTAPSPSIRPVLGSGRSVAGPGRNRRTCCERRDPRAHGCWRASEIFSLLQPFSRRRATSPAQRVGTAGSSVRAGSSSSLFFS